MEITALCTISSDGVAAIYDEEKPGMPWHAPEENRRYIARVSPESGFDNKLYLIGRRAFNLLPSKALAGKHVTILTSKTLDFSMSKYKACASVTQANSRNKASYFAELRAENAYEEVIVLGGQTTLSEVLPYIDKLELTVLDIRCAGLGVSLTRQLNLNSLDITGSWETNLVETYPTAFKYASVYGPRAADYISEVKASIIHFTNRNRNLMGDTTGFTSLGATLTRDVGFQLDRLHVGSMSGTNSGSIKNIHRVVLEKLAEKAADASHPLREVAANFYRTIRFTLDALHMPVSRTNNTVHMYAVFWGYHPIMRYLVLESVDREGRDVASAIDVALDTILSYPDLSNFMNPEYVRQLLSTQSHVYYQRESSSVSGFYSSWYRHKKQVSSERLAGAAAAASAASVASEAAKKKSRSERLNDPIEDFRLSLLRDLAVLPAETRIRGERAGDFVDRITRLLRSVGSDNTPFAAKNSAEYLAEELIELLGSSGGYTPQDTISLGQRALVYAMYGKVPADVERALCADEPTSAQEWSQWSQQVYRARDDGAIDASSFSLDNPPPMSEPQEGLLYVEDLAQSVELPPVTPEMIAEFFANTQTEEQ